MNINEKTKILDEIVDFWSYFIHGNPTGSIATTQENSFNLGHLRRALGIDDLRQQLKHDFGNVENHMMRYLRLIHMQDTMIEYLYDHYDALKKQVDAESNNSDVILARLKDLETLYDNHYHLPGEKP